MTEQMLEICKLIFHISLDDLMRSSVKSIESSLIIYYTSILKAIETLIVTPKSKFTSDNLNVLFDLWLGSFMDINRLYHDVSDQLIQSKSSLSLYGSQHGIVSHQQLTSSSQLSRLKSNTQSLRSSLPYHHHQHQRHPADHLDPMFSRSGSPSKRVTIQEDRSSILPPHDPSIEYEDDVFRLTAPTGQHYPRDHPSSYGYQHHPIHRRSSSSSIMPFDPSIGQYHHERPSSPLPTAKSTTGAIYPPLTEYASSSTARTSMTGYPLDPNLDPYHQQMAPEDTIDPMNPENWPETKDNDVVKRAKSMLLMASSMYQFTLGEGDLKTTQDLFTQAEFFAEEANKFYKVVRQFTYSVPSGQSKKDLLDNLDKVPTFVQQLQFAVKNSTVGKAATFTKVDNVISEVKNLMDFISRTVNSCLSSAAEFNLDMVNPRIRSRTMSPSGRFTGDYDEDGGIGSKGGSTSSDPSLWQYGLSPRRGTRGKPAASGSGDGDSRRTRVSFLLFWLWSFGHYGHRMKSIAFHRLIRLIIRGLKNWPTFKR